ncbi:MAG TPA: protein translocase subunit SecDF [Algoriphagus sp.]|jgi:SecD/SecF fusion protein|uniref:protein translocase subunit SecDF n=1 Tax=unclassified Algoriphagus TaxID=2641541 RepID=UPI000C3DB382|nr:MULTISPECIES: protein translocase subunit SecDF [unclassified Algoriphagus]MAL15756.1 protein translocase subunit SecDF [Algoriphagus sp.]QYH40329.1 protein translocase subunit SecDF [Algoriphagus sp. NBT04N3]HAS59259.1 protein translocase subunit SecDF [Algoriphagus sp.]HCD86609.1 protein translocase subunit SecDF [Algoriphagus sp.]|tara:strand:+ start:1912 stop:4884 length:2973 start_codon:yes stop_codon:yes gene_type:complete
MQNKGVIVFLTVIITGLCLYYLSFTFVSNGIQKNASEYATDASGNVDFAKRRAYLDSIWREPVYNFLGADFTYQEIKETELGLGLDLQGGMHVTLEVSPVEIVKGLAGNPKDEGFNKAVEDARQAAKTSTDKFVNLFYSAWQSNNPNKKLSSIFATAANRGRISLESSDSEILDIIDKEVENAIDRSFNILRTRIDRFGTSQPNIQRIQGSGRIQIELPGVDNQERVRNLLQGVAKLQFWEVAELNDLGGSLEAVNAAWVADNKSSNTPAAADTVSTENMSEEDSLRNALEKQLAEIDPLNPSTDVSPVFSLLYPNYGLAYQVRDTVVINRILKNPDYNSLLPRDIKLLWGVKPFTPEGTSDEVLELYAIKAPRGTDEAPLEGDVVTDARQVLDQTSRPAVSMQMNAEGARKWRSLTAANIGKRIAVVLDNYVYTAPVVNGEIPTGQSEISGSFSLQEAQDLANILKSGSLPAPTQIVEESIIGPTLGKEAQSQGVFSMISGLVIVVLFMLAYYSKGGLVAIAALVFNIFFILGILAQLGAALTLPGIAGIVLTIGMSIDANVLIFERIKEELRNGAGLIAAINSGYNKAFSAILDSNVTTFLTGAILYALGQGPVKGFAIVLMIGIASSFFSAVFITRVIVSWMSKKGDKSSISFSSPIAKNTLSSLNFDFLGKRKIAYLISSGIIILGLGIAAVNGLKFGVDFTGGRSYIVAFEEPVVPSELKVGLDGEFDGSVEVKTYGANNVLKVTTSYLINEDDDASNKQVEEKVKSGIASVTGLTFTDDAENLTSGQFAITGSSKVGATVADDIKASSVEAMLAALIAIFLYILVRFRKWQFSLASIIALIHDTLFVIAAFAIASAFGATFEIDQVFIAAVLTVIGYSINDTVIVFDRIRENIENRGTGKLVKIFNDAINQTLGRTLITSFTTLIVVIVLLIFGGEVLRGFSFALFIGILVGTYSSVYIATPIVVDLMKREIESEKEKEAKKVS